MSRPTPILLLATLLTAQVRSQVATVKELERTVETRTGARGEWKDAAIDEQLKANDGIRTDERSRAVVRLTELHAMRMEENTDVQISPGMLGESGGALPSPQLAINGGAVFLFSREQEGKVLINTPAVKGRMKGTQLFVRVSPGGRSFFQVLEGQVDLSNTHGAVTLAAGEAGEALPGSAPRRTAVLEANNILQWALYYPAVLDPAELGLSASERKTAAASLAAYESGDLLRALELYPNHKPASSGARLYKAGVLLAVGRVDESRHLLAGARRDAPGRRALERMIAAVTQTPDPGQPVNAIDALLENSPDSAKAVMRGLPSDKVLEIIQPLQFSGKEQAPADSGKEVRPSKIWTEATMTTAGEAIAESYYQQSKSNLTAALAAANRATEIAPENGYAWTRLAELEFSFSRHRAASAALERGLALTPRNAQAHALRGFILSAENRIADARAEFELATQLDGALGNGWLGLGLTKIKSGDAAGGRADLQTAATVEPTASIFHSYLGKAFSSEGMHKEARKDLDLARKLDPRDPTPWLYSAIEHQQNNRTNTAIGDLEESIRINDNRRLYRSQFLLDQDRAVRGANLARIYQAAGMNDVAVREATRAVESDYTNPSAHLFLANSFDALRDPRRIALRHETPWFNELLLANMLSPVGGGPLSQYVSQQEYSRLLEKDGVGGSLTAEWRDTDEFRTGASLFGTHGDFSWGLDTGWRNDPGQRLNSEAELAEVYGQMKWQASPDDVVYFLGKWGDQSSGDNFETYDNQPLAPGFDFTENQEPGLLLMGWNHQWKPGSNTLFLAGRLSADQHLSDPAAQQLLIKRGSSGMRPGFVQQDMQGFDEFTNPELRNATPPAVYAAPDGSLVYSPALLEEIAPYLGTGSVISAKSAPFDFDTRREFEIYTAELQHIWQTQQNTLIAGARWQSGTFDTDTRLSIKRPSFVGGVSTPPPPPHHQTAVEPPPR